MAAGTIKEKKEFVLSLKQSFNSATVNLYKEFIVHSGLI
jgi:hypothetical protein